MPPTNSKQKSPEEQNRQEDGNRDDDDLYETQELILKVTDSPRDTLTMAVFYRCIARSVNVPGRNGLPRALFYPESKILDARQAGKVPCLVERQVFGHLVGT